ncbi:MAG: hypothetical protein K6G87_02995, partial [Butyrivibrio sp.]|uniref:hypothetical protein n=1 Tax=Butyrivibrio sp. TaxID=28121 RepID=UPI0025CF555C
MQTGDHNNIRKDNIESGYDTDNNIGSEDGEAMNMSGREDIKKTGSEVVNISGKEADHKNSGKASKKILGTFAGTAVLLLLIISLLVVTIDPFFHYH